MSDNNGIKVKVEGIEAPGDKAKRNPLTVYIGFQKQNQYQSTGISWSYAVGEEGAHSLRKDGYTNIITITAQRED